MRWMKILCPVDFTDGSRHALDQASEVARRFDADLTLLHVVEETSGPPPGARDLAQKLSSWRTTAEQICGHAVAVSVVRGVPVREILRFAREGEYDVIVTGTCHGVGPRHMLLGKVADQVVHAATCPVLVARPVPWHGE